MDNLWFLVQNLKKLLYSPWFKSNGLASSLSCIAFNFCQIAFEWLKRLWNLFSLLSIFLPFLLCEQNRKNNIKVTVYVTRNKKPFFWKEMLLRSWKFDYRTWWKKFFHILLNGLFDNVSLIFFWSVWLIEFSLRAGWANFPWGRITTGTSREFSPSVPFGKCA